MRSNYLAIVCATALLTLGAATEVSSNQSSVPSQTSVVSAKASASPKATKSGTFVAGEHRTQGTTRIINENGKRYLELSQGFKTNNGPDLHVILYRSNRPPIYGIKKQNYALIGRLQRVRGVQRYAIPANVNLANFGSVAVWCRQFNATFGYATLRG